MENWAIVIGIDKYWDNKACLKGAVQDALNMTDWLLDRNGGNVPSRNLTLLLAPSQTSPMPRPGLGLSPSNATKPFIVQAINNLEHIPGDRFFFYYSGHGIADPLSITLEEALVPTDFTDLQTDNSLRLGSILEYFQATQFADQFFFIDACRNVPWTNLYRIGQLPLVLKPDPNLPAVQQHVFYATSPGVGAREIQEAGNERGAFTEVLLEGLKDGKGLAKTWDAAASEYVVTVDSLFECVKKEVSQRRAALTDPAHKFLQVPQLKVQRGAIGRDSNPELSRFPEQTFALSRENLEVWVAPTTVVPGAEVTAEREGNVIERDHNVQSLPVTLPLKPREYQACAKAANYQRKEARWPVVKLYEPQQVTLVLVPIPSSSPSGPVPSVPGGGSMGSVPTASGSTGGVSMTAQLTVQSSDPLAPLEVTDSIGQMLRVGQGHLDCPDLKPGFYQARLRSPENPHMEQLIDLSAGETESMHLDAPNPPDTRLVREVIQSANFDRLSDNTLVMSEEIGPVALARLSTILTLAASVADNPSSLSSSPKLRNLGVQPFREVVPDGAESGLRILFAVDSPTNEEALTYLSTVGVHLWPQSGPVSTTVNHLRIFSRAAGLAELVQPAQPGPHWLVLALPGQIPIMIALMLLPKRLTLLVISREATNRVRIFQYLPSFSRDESSEPNMMRRLELFQRFYLSGHLEHTRLSVDQVLNGNWNDPLAWSLTGYLLLRLGQAKQLESVVQRMTRLYDELSDSYVLEAAYRASLGDSNRAQEAVQAALNRGLPIFADGQRWLLSVMEPHRFYHQRAKWLTDKYNNRVQGLLWSAWTWQEDLASSIF